MSRRSQLAALLFVAALVASPVVGSISLVGSASAAPDGFVGVPDTNVEEDLPVGANTSISAADLEGSVMASQNASSLQVVLTTPERAEEYVGSAVGGGGGIALVFQDDKAHAGREVAVPADAIRESVGHIPQVVHGVHEDGSSWTSDVTARNGLLLFRIPKFSANSVTFDADVSINATATDGTTLSYDLGSMDSATDPLLNVTGVESTETETVSRATTGSFDPGLAGSEPLSATTVELSGNGFGSRTDSATAAGVSDGHSSTINVEGSLSTTSQSDPATVTLTGTSNTESESTSASVSSSGTIPVDIGGTSVSGGTVSVSAPDTTNTVKSVSNSGSSLKYTTTTNNDYPATLTSLSADVQVEHGDGVSGQFGFEVWVDGTHVATGYHWDGYATTTYSASWTGSLDIGPQSTVEIKQQSRSTNVQSTEVTELTLKAEPRVGDATVSSGSDSVTFSSAGSKSLALSPSDSSLSVSAQSTLNYDVSWTETTETTDPTVSLGGVSKTYSGTLGAGETTTMSWSPSALSSGSTEVGVSLPSLSSAAPPMTMDYEVSWTELDGSLNPSADVTGDGQADVTGSGVLSDGDSVTATVTPSRDSEWSLSVDAGNAPTVSTTVTETTLPEDVSIGLNTNGGSGEWVNLSGTLADGETVSRTFSKATLQEGSNRLTVSLGDGSLSADAPVPKIDVSYMHASEVSIDTSYVADGWTESYNVSHTFAGSRENPTVTVPFSSKVYRIPQVEMSVNGGVWENVSASKWSLANGTELTVQLTDHDDTPGVEAGDTIAVRTTGYKVNTANGQIRVVDPTAPDDPSVDAGFVVESREPGFRINVGGTENAEKVHYLYEEGWKNAAEEAVVSADGGQSLWVPHATEGAAARVTTIPLEPALDAGDVGVQVIDPDEPTFKVTPGKAGVGDAVTWRWYSTTSGERYGLRSLSRGRFTDKSEAGPQYVSLTGDDSGETMAIQQPDGSSTVPEVGDVPGVGGGVWSDPTEGVSIQEVGIVAGWAAFVVLLVAATGRSSVRGRQRWILVGALGGGTALLALEVIRPGVVSSALSGGLREVVPLAGLAAIGLVGYSVYSWWEKRKAQASTPETKVSFNLRDQK